MAGVKGRSGGARPNSGPKPKVLPPVSVPATDDASAFLLSMMNDQGADPRLRLDAAKTLYRGKLDMGKKEERQDQAKKAGTGKFAPSAPPLKLVG